MHFRMYENRRLSYPAVPSNILVQVYQHKVSPFTLADKTKPGHRKICVFFLVDPVVPIISTSQVAPQQYDWWEAELFKLGIFHDFPPEIVNMILKVIFNLFPRH